MNGLRSRRTNKGEYEFLIEIYAPVLERIKSNLLSSNVEEGGKFLGVIREDGRRVHISVYSYIDAGPKVSNSRTHIIPDGEHQEHLFRIIEGYDPNIEHIGSWHSHHSNNYSDLSHGDIEGYYHNVNNINYNLNWFFVMLVTDIRGQSIKAKYYLFHRGENRYYPFSEEHLTITNKEYKCEGILREIEQLTRSQRNERQSLDYHSSVKRRYSEWEEWMMKVRAKDKAWIEKNFPSSRALIDQRDRSISWRWTVSTSRGDLDVKYTYPLPSTTLGQAHLLIKYRGGEIILESIALTSARFDDITNQIKKAEYLVKHGRDRHDN